MKEETRWFIKIKNTGKNTYSGELYTEAGPDRRKEINKMEIGVNSGVRVKGIDTTFGEVLDALANMHDLSSTKSHKPQRDKICDALRTVDGQRDLGEYLYKQVWSDDLLKLLEDLNQTSPTGGEIPMHVTIIACDDYTARLPWVLMCSGGIFLVDRNISISVSIRNDSKEIQIGPSVRMLMVAPNLGEDDTDARQHFQDLQNRLSMSNNLWDSEKEHHKLRFVDTWLEFKRMVREISPDIVYYYGHANDARLIFPDGPVSGKRGVTSADFAAFFRQEVPESDWPKIVYINCCRGHQFGSLNLGRQLEDLFPVVVTNRTIAYVDEARTQATRFFEELLSRKLNPHDAAAYMCRIPGMPRDSIQWWTPVFYRNYGAFYNRIEIEGDIWPDKDWSYKIDRTKQYATIQTAMQGLLREKCGACAFVWYGEKGQGISTFSERLEIQLPVDLDMKTEVRQDFWVVNPVWPQIHTEKAFKDAICNAFGVKEFKEIPAMISKKQMDCHCPCDRFLVIVSHRTVSSPESLPSHALRRYIELWDEFVVPRLENGQYLLIGISYEWQDCARLGSMLNDVFSCTRVKEGDPVGQPDEVLNLLHMYPYALLDPLVHLNVSDIRDILRKNFQHWKPKRWVKVANQIIAQTEGHYINTIAELSKIKECHDEIF
ncbi:MAG: hypothetical protein ACMUIU_04775 [bacterium]